MSACMRNRLFRSMLQTAVLIRERAIFRGCDPENCQMVVKSWVSSALHGNTHVGLSALPRPFRENGLPTFRTLDRVTFRTLERRTFGALRGGAWTCMK